MSKLNLDYFHGSEAEQFSFYRLPKILFTDDRFADVSSEAKILYGLLLDRMGLSIKNGWIDEENRVYIYFKLDDVIDMLKIGKDKGIKLFAERPLEGGKTEGKNNEFNYNNINNINANDTYHISSYQQQETDAEDVIDEIEKYRYIISKNIDYECLKQNYGDDMADGVLELMTEIVCCRKPIVVVACQELPQAMVKERFLKLEYTHIEYVFDCLKKNGSRVRNIKSYMITMLYNSYTTIDHYYSYNSHTYSCARGYSTDYRSFIEFECEKAVRDNLKIVVIYNSSYVDRSKCPEKIRYMGTHIAAKKPYTYSWDYDSIKMAIV